MEIKTGMQIYQEIAEEETPDEETKLRYLEYVATLELKNWCLRNYPKNRRLLELVKELEDK